MKRMYFFLIVGFVFSIETAIAQTAISVNTDSMTHVIHPMVQGFGLVYVHEADSIYADGSVAQIFNDVGAGFLRWPGGTVATHYHWDDLTGNGWVDSWSPNYDRANDKDPSTYMDLDEYMVLCNQSGAEPMLGINMSSGMRWNRQNDGLQEAISLINYCISNNYDVEYFYLDNESYHPGNNYNKGPSNWTPTTYAQQFNIYADSIRALLPNAKLIANWNSPRSVELNTIVSIAGHNIDYIDFHFYWAWGNANWTLWKSQKPLKAQNQNQFTYVDDLNYFSTLMSQLGHPHIKPAILEWNIGIDAPWLTDPQHTPFKTALMQSEMQMQFLEAGVELAALWTTQWPGATPHLLGPNANTPNPVAKVYELFKYSIGGDVVSSTSSKAGVTELVSIKDDKAYVYLLNKNDIDEPVEFSLSDRKILGVDTALRFMDPGVYMNIGLWQVNDNYRAMLWANTFTLIVFDLESVGGPPISNGKITTLVSGDIHIHNGGNLTFFGDVNVSALGSVHNEAGTLYTRGAVNGTARIQLDEAASLDVDGGRFVLANEMDEKFTNLTLGTTGMIDVTPDSSLELTGTLSNNNVSVLDSMAGINLYANATGYAQLLTSGSIANPGVVYAQQYLTSKTTAGWRELSSPVNSTVADIEDDYPLYFEHHLDANQWNIWWYDAAPIGGPGSHAPGRQSSANAQYYKPAAAGDAFNNARPYGVYVGGPFFPEITDDALDVRGAAGHGSYNYTLYLTNDMGYGPTVANRMGRQPFDGDSTVNPLQMIGWNHIPNPYPSNIDIEALITGMNLDYQAVHIWDAPNQQYFPITKDNFPIISWNTPGSRIIGNNIPPFQAFWVKANLISNGPGGGWRGSATQQQNLTLQNAYRTVEKGSSFFKRTPAHVSLRLRNADTSKVDQTIITLDALNDNGLDFNDALKMTSPNRSVPTLSSLCEGVPLSINRLAMPSPGHAIPISLKHNQEGEPFFIEILEHDIDLSWTLHLFDWKTKVLHDLKADGAYSFTNDTEWKEVNRFTFYINYKAANFDPFNNVKIWGSREGIEITFANPGNDPATIEIMDVSGRRLYFNNKVPTNQNFIWPLDFGEPHMYVVRVTTDGMHKMDRVLR